MPGPTLPRRLLAIALAITLASTLVACAKKAQPSPPKTEPDTFNRTYPSE